MQSDWNHWITTGEQRGLVSLKVPQVYITCRVLGYQIHFNLIWDHQWLVIPMDQFNGYNWTLSVFWWWPIRKHVIANLNQYIECWECCCCSSCCITFLPHPRVRFVFQILWYIFFYIVFRFSGTCFQIGHHQKTDKVQIYPLNW